MFEWSVFWLTEQEKYPLTYWKYNKTFDGMLLKKCPVKVLKRSWTSMSHLAKINSL